jgi:hypothetical protein
VSSISYSLLSLPQCKFVHSSYVLCSTFQNILRHNLFSNTQSVNFCSGNVPSFVVLQNFEWSNWFFILMISAVCSRHDVKNCELNDTDNSPNLICL